MIVFNSRPSFEEWCEATGHDPESDESYNSYCEWKSNS